MDPETELQYALETMHGLEMARRAGWRQVYEERDKRFHAVLVMMRTLREGVEEGEVRMTQEFHARITGVMWQLVEDIE